MTLHVAGLWRYAVKTLAGERLSSAVIGLDGMRGDRLVRVRGPEGVRTARRHYRLLGLRGTLGPDGRPRINGHTWDSPDATGVPERRCLDYLSGLDYGLSYPHLAGLTEFFRRLVHKGRVPNGTLTFLPAA